MHGLVLHLLDGGETLLPKQVTERERRESERGDADDALLVDDEGVGAEGERGGSGGQLDGRQLREITTRYSAQ